VSGTQSVLRQTIPLCGIVLVLGSVACNRVGVIVGNRVYAARQSEHSTPADQELIILIQDFLKNVPANERSTYDRFFADDVIYTRNSGQVVTKKDILADTGNPTVRRANATFDGEDFTVHQYGDLAVVNFRLVMHGAENGQAVTRSFRNTGTFAKRNGQWQAVAWQATPIAEKK
jgi:ketosteroid isomerase-like protein